jgi:hypothetical protein
MDISNTLLKYGTELGGLLLVGILGFTLLWLKSRIFNIMKKPALQDQVEVDLSIRDVLAAARSKMDAHRSYVYMFHNGDYYNNGNSILKMSCTHESVAAGISKEGAQAQGILVSTVPEAVLSLVEAGNTPETITITHIHNLQPCYYRSAMEAQGVATVAKCALYKNNNIIGFVGVDFLHDEIDIDKLHFLKDYSPRLEFLVNQQAPKSFWDSLTGFLKG